MLLSLSNRIYSKGKNKIKLNLILNKPIQKEKSNFNSKSLNYIEFKKNKNQSCISPIDNLNYNTITTQKNFNSKEKKYQLIL